MANINTTNKRRAESVILLAIIGVVSSFAFILTAGASGITPNEVITLANGARSQAGLSVLSENSRLSEAAQAKAEDMLKHDYFAHTSPIGVEPWYWIKQAGYQYKAAGENLAINYTSATEQHGAWMKSETHRANIMNAHYREIGVAVARGKINGKESLVTVEYFGTPLAAVADQVAPVPSAPVVAPAEIKGVETAESAPPTLLEAMPAPALVVPTVPTPKRSWLEVAALAWLVLASLLLPLVFLSQVLRALWIRKPLEKEVSTENTLMAIIPVVPSINIDSIHHHSPAQ